MYVRFAFPLMLITSIALLHTKPNIVKQLPHFDTKGRSMQIRKIVIPAAGYGTRFLPFTKVTPKELLPLLNKPCLQEVIEEGINSDASHFYIIDNEDKKAIENYFKPNVKLETALKKSGKSDMLASIESMINNADFSFINQPQMLGLGHAILLTKKSIGNEYFGVILPDEMIMGDTPAIGQLIEIAQRERAIVIGVQEVAADQIHAYGSIKINKDLGNGLYEVADIVEKPKNTDEAPSLFAIIGRYVFSPEIFQAIEEISPQSKGEIQLTDAIALLAKRGHKVLAYTVKGKRFDTGRPPGWLAANVYAGLNSPEYGKQIKKQIGELLS